MRRILSKIAAVLSAAVLMCGLLAAAGCSGGDSQNQASGSMRIGTMQTEDSLPFWVAQQQDLYRQNGVDVEIITFQSAQELSTAFAAGEIDAAMTDIQVSAALVAGGVDLDLAWVTLGTDPSQGRFGIMTSSSSGITSLEDLAGVPIGVGSNTVPEYVMDKLMAAAGVPEADIVGEEIKKVPVRYEAMANDQVAAAALPGSLLALGEAQGMVLLADDTQGENISQSVFAVRASWLKDGGEQVLDGVRNAWNQAVDSINADPESFRALLTEKANLPELVAGTYPVAAYPQAAVPTQDMVAPVLEWMQAKGYLSAGLSYDPVTGQLRLS